MYVKAPNPSTERLVLVEREVDPDTGQPEPHMPVEKEYVLEFNSDGIARVTKDVGTYALEQIESLKKADRSEPNESSEED